MVEMVSVVPDYMKAMGTRLMSGRCLTKRDMSGSDLVIIVNEAFGGRFIVGQEVVGKRVRVGTRTGPWSTIVGVVEDVRQRGPEGRDSGVVA